MRGENSAHYNWYFHQWLSVLYDVAANCLGVLTQSIKSLDTLDVMPAPIKQTDSVIPQDHYLTTTVIAYFVTLYVLT